MMEQVLASDEVGRDEQSTLGLLRKLDVRTCLSLHCVPIIFLYYVHIYIGVNVDICMYLRIYLSLFLHIFVLLHTYFCITDNIIDQISKVDCIDTYVCTCYY